MKRTGGLLLLLCLMILTLPLYLFMPKVYFFLNLAFTLFIILILIFEPYWKKGAVLLCLGIIEFLLFLVNFSIFRKFLLIHTGIHVLTLLFVILIVFIAHILRISENKQNKNRRKNKQNESLVEKEEEIVDEKSTMNESTDSKSEDVDDNEIGLDISNENNEVDNEVGKKTIEKSYYLTTDKKVHLSGCLKIVDIDNATVTSSKRYAESKKFKPCDECRPF
jgi:predicted membrane protein